MAVDSPDGSTDEELTLYRLHGCPYCERVVLRLEEYGVPYRSRFVSGEHSRRDAVKREAGVRSVPVVVDPNTGVTMAESGRIVDYLDRTYGNGARTDGGRRIVDGDEPRDGGA